MGSKQILNKYQELWEKATLIRDIWPETLLTGTLLTSENPSLNWKIVSQTFLKRVKMETSL